MARRYVSIVGLVVVLGFVLAACGSGDDDEAVPTVTRIPNPPNAPVLTPEGSASPADAGASSPVAVEASPMAGSPVAGSPEAPPAAEEPAGLEVVSVDIDFIPAELAIPADTAVTILLPNEGAAPHNFSIDELEISIDQAPGSTESVELNAPAGSYEYYCNIPGHREAGMVGTLTVE